jgi:hypothetical protein
MYEALKRLGQELLLPVYDYFTALKACIAEKGSTLIIAIVVAFFAGWWVYVPLHELFHAFGCILGGGEVSRLELSEIYGATLLSRVFPFISVGSEYAGRLTGFETHNNDLTYLLTVFFPYLLTVFIGVPLLRFAGHGEMASFQRCIWFGASLPVAYAPFISMTGDYYEMGSILVTGVASLFLANFQVERWRSDDLIRLADELVFSTETVRTGDILGMIFSFLLGIIMIFLTYRAGRFWSRFAFKL